MLNKAILDAMGDLDDEIIQRAKVPQKTRRRKWLKWGALAACLCVVVGGVLGVIPLLPIGGSSGGGGQDGLTYMSYAGPVFPLTALEDTDGLTAERHLDFDFSPYKTVEAVWSDQGEVRSCERYSAESVVTDRYILSNTTGQDRAVTLLYPFASGVGNLKKCLPTLTVDGQAAETELHIGGYTGGYEAAWGSRNSKGTLNLAQPSCWEDFRAVLSDGRYLEHALGEYPDLTGTPVTVYRFTDSWGPEPDEKAGVPNPCIRAYFDLDYSKTTVMTWGFHMATYDRENGSMIQGFSIPGPGDLEYDRPYYLLVVGEDIQNLTTGCYATGGTEADTMTCEGGVAVERYEGDLEQVLRELVTGWKYDKSGQLAPGVEFVGLETWYGLFKEWLVSAGPLSNSGIMRYDSMLESNDVNGYMRVCYLSVPVIVPAGGSIEVTARMTKSASVDYVGNRNRNGYDMVTRLGSSLVFTRQTASLSHTGDIKLLRQNFGFDLENNVTEVTLDLSEEHYYLEVVKIKK